MPIIPVKYQPFGINVREIPLRISWQTYIKHSKPYIFIIKKQRSLQMDFSHLLFYSAVILIFGGLFLHRLYRLLKFKFNWILVPKTDFAIKNS